MSDSNREWGENSDEAIHRRKVISGLKVGVSDSAPKSIREGPLRRGEPIPGSRYFRAFCGRCGDPMRVDYAHLREATYCETCAPRPLKNRAATKDDTNPYQENAVRSMEDR